MLWTLFSAFAVWWLLAHPFHSPSVVTMSNGGDGKSTLNRTGNWLELAHVYFHRAYLWVLLAPYVIWLASRFPIEKQGRVWRAALLIVVGIGFVVAAQEFNSRLSQNLPAVVFIYKGQISSGPQFVMTTNRSTAIMADHQKFLEATFATNFLKGDLGFESTGIANDSNISASIKALTEILAAKITSGTNFAVSATNLEPTLSETALSVNNASSAWLDGSLFSDGLAYCALIGLAHGGLYYRRYREREQQAAILENRLSQARLRTLQAQLQPHFLFNALNGIATLIRRDAAAAEEMIAALGELLRLALSQSDRQEISLREELEFLHRYVEIQQMRFRDRLTVEEFIAPELHHCAVPAIVLQPLVENAIRHGIEPSPEPGWVRVSASREGERLMLTVEDNGVGLGQGGSSGTGHGLANIRERLEALHPRQHEFQFGERAGRGVIVRISIPWKMAASSDSTA